MAICLAAHQKYKMRLFTKLNIFLLAFHPFQFLFYCLQRNLWLSLSSLVLVAVADVYHTSKIIVLAKCLWLFSFLHFLIVFSSPIILMYSQTTSTTSTSTIRSEAAYLMYACVTIITDKQFKSCWSRCIDKHVLAHTKHLS